MCIMQIHTHSHTHCENGQNKNCKTVSLNEEQQVNDDINDTSVQNVIKPSLDMLMETLGLKS